MWIWSILFLFLISACTISAPLDDSNFASGPAFTFTFADTICQPGDTLWTPPDADFCINLVVSPNSALHDLKLQWSLNDLYISANNQACFYFDQWDHGLYNLQLQLTDPVLNKMDFEFNIVVNTPPKLSSDANSYRPLHESALQLDTTSFITFSWQFVNAYTAETNKYHLQIYQSDSLIFDQEIAAANYYRLDKAHFSPSSIYHWRLAATDLWNFTDYSPWWLFSTRAEGQ